MQKEMVADINFKDFQGFFFFFLGIPLNTNFFT